jgi:hypothetical protein
MENYVALQRVAWDSIEQVNSTLRPQGRPVIIEGAIVNWPAAQLWSPSYLKSVCGTRIFHAEIGLPIGPPSSHELERFQRRLALSEFIDLMADIRSTSPCYISNKDIQLFDGLENDVAFEKILGDEAWPGYTRMWIGSAGTRSSLHFDFHENILIQIYGEKEAVLVAPTDGKYVYPVPGYIDKSEVDGFAPDSSRYPMFAKAIKYFGTLNPGDALLIPRCWWHALDAKSPSISVNHFFGPRLDVREMIPAIAASGARGWLKITSDLVNHGILGKPFATRLYSAEPFGVWFWQQIRGYFRKRFGS